MTNGGELIPGQDRIATVTEFTRRVKGLLESQIPPGWVRGEVSNLRQQSSGHVYFSLKDAGAQLSAVLFRGDALRQSVELRDGQQVIVFGEISVYEARGNYQLIARAIVDDGVGRLQREFEALKRRLQAEGLFSSERKRALPEMARTVGFITSPTGAAVRDFIQILRRRKWRGRVVVLPAKVQGAGAAEELVAMLRQAAELELFDILVIGRGGGSLEDLWAFNEEVLVRAVAASPVPVISAVGHEIDVTLCDFAADVRAETPSGAAELISSRFVACNERLDQAGVALLRRVDNEFSTLQRRVEHQRARLRLLSPSAQVEQGFLRLDDLANRFAATAQRRIQDARHAVSDAAHGLARHSPEFRVQQESHRLLGLWKRLQAASPKSVLNRGFVILRDAKGTPLQRRAEVLPGAEVTAEFADGSANLTAGTNR
ncbi:MAG: exodeoxyribonuclease VII large subunit [Opitutaceae bacterium]|nr:exodeoxyribonuclease VII large subunit [Opitutaceae bacterium]